MCGDFLLRHGPSVGPHASAVHLPLLNATIKPTTSTSLQPLLPRFSPTGTTHPKSQAACYNACFHKLLIMRPAVGRSTLIAPEMGSGQGLKNFSRSSPGSFCWRFSAHPSQSTRIGLSEQNIQANPPALPVLFPLLRVTKPSMCRAGETVLILRLRRRQF
jgi:hypothetical protein